MHFRAEQRGFDWVKKGQWKIKDHPEVFLEPTQAEQKAKMPPPPPDFRRTVLIEGNKEVADDAVAAAAAVVDASVTPGHTVFQTTEAQTAAAAAVAATLVADPTADLGSDDAGRVESI
jgi:RecJ-like exonuclease